MYGCMKYTYGTQRTQDIVRHCPYNFKTDKQHVLWIEIQRYNKQYTKCFHNNY